jgi:uncharacterized protein (TIGR02301 family)
MRRGTITAAAVAGALLLAAGIGGGRAQEAPPPSASAPPATLPYDVELLRLAEIMGGLHYLARLCDGNSDWRDQMEALLAAEEPDPDRKARMIDRFNHGYESYRSVYRNCTVAARAVVQRYLDEGARLAADIGQRYGNAEGK